MKPRPSNQAGAHRPGPSGESVRADELLPWSALHTRLGWGSRTVAKAQRDGLRVLTYGGRKYVTGRSLIDFLDAHPLAGDQGGGGNGGATP
jgi:hypothetical protein